MYINLSNTAVHGTLICSVLQMLVDPDNNDPVEVSPAILISLWTSGMNFKEILVKGSIVVTNILIEN
jgi:hypothetical protein